jgi:lysophospholipase L1-like esterase
MSAARSVAGALLMVVTLAACTSQASAPRSAAAPQAPVIYAAIGASETYGVGVDDRYRQAWPQVFYNDSLPSAAVLYNFGIPSATTAQALKDELPAALAVHPTVASVWLNVNDLVQGVSAADYGAQLRQLVHALRQGGKVRVLVANVPDLRLLPAYKACLPNAPDTGPACLLPAGLVPSPSQVVTIIDAYNRVIAQVVAQEGATLVDLYTQDALIAQHPEWISSDGFHPNALGYLAIAHSFEDAYRRHA